MLKTKLAVLLAIIMITLTACGARGNDAEGHSTIPANPVKKELVGEDNAAHQERLMGVSPYMEVTKASGTGEKCLQIDPGTPYLDVTIPDGMVVEPGVCLIKIWRLKNSGTCIWTPEFQLIWFSGENLGTTTAVYLSKTVHPGEMVDIAIDIQTPSQAGTYQSNWKLMTPQGELFGLGSNGNAPIWVTVEVRGQAGVSALPTISVTPVPPVLVEGSVLLTVGETLDLDNGVINPLDGADIFLSEDLSLNLVNGTQRSASRSDPPVFSDCNQTEWFVDQIAENGMEIKYYCYRSSQGLPGYLRITQLDIRSGLVEVEFFTWALP